MNRNIATRFPELLDEMDIVMGDLMNKSTEGMFFSTTLGTVLNSSLEWVSIPCYKSAVHIISRVGARFFVGPQLSESDDSYPSRSSDPRFRCHTKIYGYHALLRNSHHQGWFRH